MDESDRAGRDSAGGETVDKDVPKIEGDAVKWTLKFITCKSKALYRLRQGSASYQNFYPSRSPACHQFLSEDVV